MDITQKRAEERAPFAAAVDYTYSYSEEDRLKCFTAVGITTNLSDHGLGFYTYAPVSSGQAVTVFSRQLSPEPLVTEARWCSKVSDTIFKVGLRFEKPLSAKAAGPGEMPQEKPSEPEAFSRNDMAYAMENIATRVAAIEKRLNDVVEELLLDNQRLESLSVTDDLTGVHNRRFFYERLEAERNLLDRYGHTLSVMLLDIDNFKYINDHFGHLAGDALLKEFAEIVKKGFRKGDLFARYGGEEFAAILPHTSGRAALAAAENIRKMVESTAFQAIEGKKRITVSIGVNEIGEEIRTPQEAVRRADRALYEAKIRGKNTVLLWPKRQVQ